MDLLVQAILGLIALVCVLPLAVLAVELLSRSCARPHPAESTTPRPRLAVLVPAHDEEQGLPRTLADIVAGLAPGDRCVVVADNCRDGTAQAARAFPVDVLERTDTVHRGKGYALQHGIAHLRADPPDVVLVIDADCRVEVASFPILARAAVATGRPIQGGNVLYPPLESSVGSRVSAFAFLFKNHIRPLGLSQWGGPLPAVRHRHGLSLERAGRCIPRHCRLRRGHAACRQALPGRQARSLRPDAVRFRRVASLSQRNQVAAPAAGSTATFAPC